MPRLLERFDAFECALGDDGGALGLHQPRFGDGKLRFGLGHVLEVLVIVETGDDLAALHQVGEIEGHAGDAAGDLRGDGDAGGGLESAAEDASEFDRPLLDERDLDRRRLGSPTALCFLDRLEQAAGDQGA
jgi:hypothetical protein